jgi:uncharacterized protein
MNNHLKLILYIAMIAGIFLFVQDRFDLFDVSFKDEQTVQSEEAYSEGHEEILKVSEQEDYVEINIPNGLAVRVDVDVAKTDAQRSRGLSGRRYLGDYEGMLFVFQSVVNSPFWMKDMLIPLDIMFIDSQNYIVDIKENQQPCSANYCPPISSKDSFMYVLEVNAGFCEENSIEDGYRVVQYLQ